MPLTPLDPRPTTTRGSIQARYALYAAEARFHLEIERQIALDAMRRARRCSQAGQVDETREQEPSRPDGVIAGLCFAAAAGCVLWAAVIRGCVWFVGQFGN